MFQPSQQNYKFLIQKNQKKIMRSIQHHSKTPSFSDNIQSIIINQNSIQKQNGFQIDDNFQFAFHQFFEKYHQQQQQNQHSQEFDKKTFKTYAPIKKQQLEKVFKYFKKYQPLYLNRVEIKQLSYKFKKGVQIKKYKQGYYFGEVKEHHETYVNQNGEEKIFKKKFKHGKGIFVYGLFSNSKNQEGNDMNNKNGKTYKKVYQGQWQNDKKQGVGFQRFVDGSVYHGYYHLNKPEGRGKFTNAQGEVYEGAWKNGVKQGQGFWKNLNGQTYIGEFKDGIPQGYGVFINMKGDRYEGQFKKSLKHGEGIQRFINGDIYKGYYQNGKPSGFGQYYWKNKSYFKGYFKNGLRTGQGLWKRGAGNCDKYQGQYQNDKKWGYGVFTWANGNVFKGNYTGDLRNGYGQMHWIDGSYYKGNWKDGVQHGKGELFIVRQGLRIGKFQNNQIVQIQYQQPYENLMQQQNQQEKIIQKPKKNIKTSKGNRRLLRNISKQSNLTSKSKSKSMKFTGFSKQKTQQSQENTFKNSNPKTLSRNNNGKPSQNAINYQQTENDKIQQQQQMAKSKLKNNLTNVPNILQVNKMRSVPLQQLFNSTVKQNNNNESNRYSQTRFVDTSSTNKQLNVFRIKKSQPSNSVNKIDQSFDQGRKASTDTKRKNRILHSSFYLHKFKNIGKPQNLGVMSPGLHENYGRKPFFNSSNNNSGVEVHGQYLNSGQF